MTAVVKICGLTRAKDVVTAVAEGAAFVGVVFFPPSPRFIAPAHAAEILDGLPENVCKVGLFVDPDDTWLAEAINHVRLDMIQLHGQESADRVEAIRQTFSLPVMKAIALSTTSDLEVIPMYLPVTDWLLFDTKPPTGANCPGGHGVSFDWSLLQSRGTHWPVPWMLAGGLTSANVTEAIHYTGAAAVDVSSGVENHPGVKSTTKIRAFLKAVRTRLNESHLVSRSFRTVVQK